MRISGSDQEGHDAEEGHEDGEVGLGEDVADDGVGVVHLTTEGIAGGLHCEHDQHEESDQSLPHQ